MASGLLGLALGSIALGLTHGLAPGHGWAIAASYALNKPNKWFYGAVSSLILGIGHLISSIAMVLVYFWAISYFGVTQIGWMNYVAGGLLILLGVWQYFNGHEHGSDGHDEDHHSHSHDSDNGHAQPNDGRVGVFARLRSTLPFMGNSAHSHDHADEASDRGLCGMAVLAFTLGFTHNEEFDIIAICTGPITASY